MHNSKPLGIFGIPYHGLLENGTITLPNGEKITQPGSTELFPGFSVPLSTMPVNNGDTELYAIPNQPTIERTPQEQALDDANHYQWHNKVLVSQGRIGGTQLDKGWILYADPNNNTWLLHVTLSVVNEVGNAHWVIKVVLRQLFGRISKKIYPEPYKTLLEEKIPIDNQAAGSLLGLDNLTLSRSTSGREVLVNLYMQGGNARNTILGRYLVGVKLLRISGTGTIAEDESHGDGISVTIEPFADFQDVYQRTYNHIPMVAQMYAFSKINCQTEILSGPAVPPLCETHHQVDTWDLGPVLEGSSEFKKQFITVNNGKPITNWYGFEESYDCKLRYFFDSNNQLHYTRLKKTKSELKRDTFTFSGQGMRETGPNEYYESGGNCVPKALPVFTEQNSAQCDEIHEYKIDENWSLYLNDELINEAPTSGYSIQTFRYLYSMYQGPDGSTNTQDDYTITRKTVFVGDQQVRDYTSDMLVRNSDGYDPYYPNPFDGGQLAGDDAGGVWPHYEVMYICNQLVTLNLKRNFYQASYQTPYTFYTFALAGPGIKDSTIYSAYQKYGELGSYNPCTGQYIRYWNDGSPKKVWV